MKKTIWIASAALALCLLMTSVFAAGTMAIHAEMPQKAAAGETIEVKVVCDENPGYVMGMVTVTWDPSILELTDIAYNDSLAPDQGTRELANNGTLPVCIGDAMWTTDVTGVGTFFTLTFKVADSAGGKNAAVTLSGKKTDFVNNDLEDVPVSFEGASITVTGTGAETGDPVGGNTETPVPAADPGPAQTPGTSEVLGTAQTPRPENDPEPAADPVEEPVTAEPAKDPTPTEPAGGPTGRETPASVKVPDPADLSAWVNPFTDVGESDPFYEAVRFVNTEGLFIGVSETRFAPETTMTRAMFVTVLGRYSGVDVEQWQEVTFGDVVPGQWYTPYIAWAQANGIVLGYSEAKFGVDDKVTIEQAAVILERYARFIGKNTETAKSGLDGYADADDVSDWAVEAMRFAVGAGVYEPTGIRLDPQKDASRSLVAQMMYGFAKWRAE